MEEPIAAGTRSTGSGPVAAATTNRKQTRSPRCRSERIELINLIVALNYPYGSTVTVAFLVVVTSPASMRPLAFTS
jgi:hypothetical protein